MKINAWMLSLALASAPLSVDAANVSSYPIATTAAGESSFSLASDGSNILFAIQGDAGNDLAITAQLVDSAGSLIGSRISTGRGGSRPVVAFTGSNYLLAWSDDAPSNETKIYGQFISTTGATIGTPFVISNSAGPFDVSVIHCAAAGCTVIWHDEDTKALFGRAVSPSGSFLSDEFYIEDPSQGTSIDSGPAIGGPTAIATDSNGNSIAVYDT